MPEEYRQTKSAAGKLKLKALSLLALGSSDERFESARLFRAAARDEQRAISLLDDASAETRLGAAVERCGCFVDARAPSAAALAWGDVLVESESVAADVAQAMISRLRPRFDALQRDHRAAIQRAPELSRSRFLFFRVDDLKRGHAELNAIIDRFPGELELWYLSYQLHFFSQKLAPAWSALRRARQLDPLHQILLGSEIQLTPRVMPADEAERHLEVLWAQIRRDRPQLDTSVFWCMALSCATFAARSPSAATLYRRALDSVELGLAARTDLLDQKPLLRGLRMLVVDLAAGRTPGVDTLYRLGLGDLVVRASPADRSDPLRILAAANAQRMEPLRLAV